MSKINVSVENRYTPPTEPDDPVNPDEPVVDPAVPNTNADPDNPSTPDTGIFTIQDSHGRGESVSTPVVIAYVLGLAVLCGIFYYLVKKLIEKKKSFTFHRTKQFIRLTVSAIALVALSCVLINGEKEDLKIASAAGDVLTVTAEDVNMNVDIFENPVFAVASSSVYVSTSTEGGYVLSAYITDTDMVSSSNSANKIPMNSTTSPSKLTENTWGVAFTRPDNENSTVFRSLPTTAAAPLTIKTKDSATSANDETTIYYGVYLNHNQPSGTYSSGVINYVAVANVVEPITHTLTVNYGTGISGVTVGDVAVANGGTIDLIQNMAYTIRATSASDYRFSSWNSTSGSVANNSSSTTTFTIGTSNATLTATATSSIPNIQNLYPTDCTTTASRARDIRDGHVYTIQRLADGKCWMMENLDLGRETLITDLTSSNTNLSTTISKATFNSWKNTSWSEDDDKGSFIVLNGADSVSGNAYGVQYNFYAASAGTISGTTNSQNAEYDICPAGWRLPTGWDNGDFDALYQQYHSYSQMRASVANGGAAFALAGEAYEGLIGQEGYYWASTRYNDASMNALYIGSTNGENVIPTGNYWRNTELSIRCLLKTGSTPVPEPDKTISDIVYMQDFAELTSTQKTSVVDSMAANTVYTFIDNRDLKVYDVTKMKDGNVWMTENLDLGQTALTVNLTSANTNIANTITAATFNGWKKTVGSNSLATGEYISVTGTDASSNTPYGTLYNFYAASAGTVSGVVSGDIALYDICPAGWRLPLGGSSSEFMFLYVNYDTSEKMQAPIANGGAAYALAGHFHTSAPEFQETYGNYWSSDGGAHTNNESLLNAGEVRGYGFSIRCILK